MSTILIAVFALALAGTALSALLEHRREQSGSSKANWRGNHSQWSEAARILELELSFDSDDDEMSMRGTINNHWVSVEQDDDGIEIEVNFRSGTGPFLVTPKADSNARADQTLRTGDDAFDERLSVRTRTLDELEDYLSPGRRNALLWLDSTFELDSVNNDEIEVRFTGSDWQPEELAAAIKLVVDVAEILEAGEKVFMAPPSQDGPQDDSMTQDVVRG